MEHDNVNFGQDAPSSRFALLKARHESGCFGCFETCAVTPSFFITFSLNQIKSFECISASTKTAPRLVSTFNLSRLELEIMDAKVATVDDQPSIIYQTVNRQAQEQNLWVVSMFGGEPFKTSFPIPAQSACLSVSNVLNLFNQQGSNFLNQTHIAVAHRNQLYVGFVSQKSGIFSSSEMQMVSLSSGKDFKITCIEVFETKDQDWCLFLVGTNEGYLETWKMGSDGEFELMFTIQSVGSISSISLVCKINQKSELFLGHAFSGVSSQLIGMYYIDEDFSAATKVVTMTGAAAYKNSRGKITSINLSNYQQESPMLYSIYELSNAVCYFEAFDLVFNKSIYQIELKDKVLDLAVTANSPQCSILFEDHLAKYYPEEKVSEENFEPNFSKTPLFEALFSKKQSDFAYSEETISSIKSMRYSLDNVLMFDKLLLDTKISLTLYPPQDPTTLELLFNKITGSLASGMVKNCLIYYLLKDNSASNADSFALKVSLSRPFVTAVNGFWSLDHGNYAEAVKYLSDPAVDLSDPQGQEENFGWYEKIILALYKGKQYSLGLLFIQATGPSLMSEKIIKSVLEILSKTYLLGALDFQRKFCTFDTENSLNLIFTECFSNAKNNENLLSQLVTAPFTGVEERYLLEYCRSSSSILLYDFLLNFYIQRGRYAEALQAYNTLFVAKGLGDNPQRQNMMKNVGMLLPKTQLLALGLPIPAYIPQKKVQTSLSQSSLIRDGVPSQKTVLKALQENYVLSTPASVPQEKPVFGLPIEDDVEMKSVNVETPSKMKVGTSANNTPGPILPSAQQSPSSPFIQPPFTFRSEEEPFPSIQPPRRESIVTTNFPGSPYSTASNMIAESPVSAQKPPLTSWNISQTPVPIKLHTAASSLSISSKQPTPLVANTPPLVSRSPLSFKNPTPSPKPISTPFGSSVSVALNFFVKPIMNYQMAPVDINSPQKSRSLVESRDSIAQTTPEKRSELDDAPSSLPRQDEVDMEIDLPETSIVASSVQSSSAVATADRKTSKLARSARKSAKTKSAPTSELSPRRLRKTPARVKSNTSTPALSRESSPVKEVLSQKSVDILPLETPVPVVRSKSASTASLRRTNLPEKTIVEKEETPARTMRSTRSTKSKKAEPSDAVWKKANTYGARLHPELAEEPVAVTHSTPSLRKQVASKAIKKDLGLESDISVTESGSKSTVERPLTRQRRKNLETGS